VNAPPERQVPTVAIAVGLLLCVAGLAVSGYLTLEHFDASVTLSCPDTGTINCQKVTTSQYSSLLGIPVALLGLAYFVVGMFLLLPSAWRSPDPALIYSRLAWAALGVLMVLYLVWAEFYGVNAICLWCTSVHAITLALFAVVVFAEAWVLPITSPAAR
jgi:uncharacterized membrane protein